MAIVQSRIESDAVQADGRRYITEVHVDHVGGRHEFVWMAEPDQDVASILPGRATWLADYLAQQELAENLAEAGGEV